MNMSAWGVLMLVVIVLVGVALFRAVMDAAPGEGMLCTTCGTVGEGKTKTGGSLLIEIVLWLCFIIPGLIYSLWRLTTRKRACAACGAATLVPRDSPIAQKLLKDLKSP